MRHYVLPKENDAQRKKAERIYQAGCVRAWSKMLKDVIAVTLGIFDSAKRDRMLFESIPDEKFETIRSICACIWKQKFKYFIISRIEGSSVDCLLVIDGLSFSLNPKILFREPRTLVGK